MNKMGILLQECACFVGHGQMKGGMEVQLGSTFKQNLGDNCLRCSGSD